MKVDDCWFVYEVLFLNSEFSQTGILIQFGIFCQIDEIPAIYVNTINFSIVDVNGLKNNCFPAWNNAGHLIKIV